MQLKRKHRIAPRGHAKPWMISIALFVLVLVGGCKSQPPFQAPFTRQQIDWKPSLVLDSAEAERILGNQSRLEKVTAYLDNGTKTYQSAFRDDWLDPETGKTGILYYMYEEYVSADTARSFLDSTLKANHISLTEGLHAASGAEIYYMSGSEVVRMAMILKENHLVRVKVNQVTSRYNLDEFRLVTRDLANML
jgi:hypothetical protein